MTGIESRKIIFATFMGNFIHVAAIIQALKKYTSTEKFCITTLLFDSLDKKCIK